MPATEKSNTKRSKRQNFYYHVAPKEEKTMTNHRYIKYSSTMGRISTNTLSIQTPVLQEMATYQDTAFNDDISMDSADDFQTGRGDIAIDEAYLSYLEKEDDIDVVKKFKRIRFKGVSELRVHKIFDTHF
jgi:hypothetical protein